MPSIAFPIAGAVAGATNVLRDRAMSYTVQLQQARIDYYVAIGRNDSRGAAAAQNRIDTLTQQLAPLAQFAPTALQQQYSLYWSSQAQNNAQVIGETNQELIELALSPLFQPGGQHSIVLSHRLTRYSALQSIAEGFADASQPQQNNGN